MQIGIDLGATKIEYVLLDNDNLELSSLTKSNIIYLEGYLFDLPEAKDIFYKVVDKAKENNYQVALSLSDPFCVERHRTDFIKLINIIF